MRIWLTKYFDGKYFVILLSTFAPNDHQFVENKQKIIMVITL